MIFEIVMGNDSFFPRMGWWGEMLVCHMVSLSSILVFTYYDRFLYSA